MRQTYRLLLLGVPLMAVLPAATAQTTDTMKTVNLNEIVIKEYIQLGGMDRLPDVEGGVIYAGKKTEVIQIEKINADLSTNNTRQVFGRVPGVSIWENDGSGIQVGVATRGLSPNRSWEFNVKQNGQDVSSEAFGYPEAYYTPPMEALGKIEVVRGAASLQYGPQFGGIINYQIRKGNPHKPISFETQQTVGSYGLFNTYNAVGGTVKKFSYYGFLHHRTAEGWRNNSFYSIYTGYFSASYQLSKSVSLAAEYTKMDYKSQQAGGLTDGQFQANPRQSARARNWFGTPWNLASATLKYAISPGVSLQVKAFATIAQRNSVGYNKPITTKDSINPATLQYNARQVDRDYYRNYGAEARLSVTYRLLGRENAVAGGVRAYTGRTKRDQLGTGTAGSGFDLGLTNPQYGRSLEFGTTNYALFAENIFRVGDRLKVVPGLRYEFIRNTSSGYIAATPAGTLRPDARTRQLLLYGLGTEFMASKNTHFYGNYSLAYRPVTFSELTPSANIDIIDPNLSDASGFNADLGYRGTVKDFLNFDVGVFYLHYDNRIGTVMQEGTPFRTNIGTSASRGVESYVEVNPLRLFMTGQAVVNLSLFASNSFIDARYVRWNNPAISNDPTKSIANKQVENAPRHIHRFGATLRVKGFSATLQTSHVGAVFTDASNTEAPNAAATLGRLPAYRVTDASCSYQFLKRYNIKAGVNNLTDSQYATRRSGGYPGPGLLPGNGRTAFLSIGATI